MSDPILPLLEWPEGISQARVPANDNALRVQALVSAAVGVSNDGAGAVDGDVFIVGSAPTGDFAAMDENDIALYVVDPVTSVGSWYPWAPVPGIRLVVNDVRKLFDGTAWIDDPAGSGGGGSVAWGAVTGTLSAQTDLASALAAKQARAPSIQSVTSAGTVTPTFADDMVIITAQAAALALANPTGTPINGLGIVIRVKDNGTARAITYGTQYRAIGITLPTTTVISKTTYIAMIYNATDTTWDCIATGTQA